MDLICADVLEWAASYQGEKFHALLCDPPYELGFMGKDWDRSGIAFDPDTWAALAEHLHPGAFGMAFASARGWHRLAVAIEDAGLRIHPSIFGWAYGSGFPKATRIDTQIDKAAGAKRIGSGVRHVRSVKPYDDNSGWNANNTVGNFEYTLPSTELAQAWEGHRYGLQCMKPALEPIIVFQKPYEGKPVECITETGAGALWIDGGRITHDAGVDMTAVQRQHANNPIRIGGAKPGDEIQMYKPGGRWPANFCLVHHPECVRVGTERVRGSQGIRGSDNGNKMYGGGRGLNRPITGQKVGYTDPDGLETVAKWDCHPECPVRKLGEQSGESSCSGQRIHKTDAYENVHEGYQRKNRSSYVNKTNWRGPNDTGTAARFFYQAAWNLEHADPVLYCAKASRKERDAGLEEMPNRIGGGMQGTADQTLKTGSGNTRNNKMRNPHPTVKPLELTRWLATLLLPPGEYAPRQLLVPFAGVASEMIGAGLAGWDSVLGIELSEENVEIGKARLAHWLEKPRQLELVESWT